MPPSWSNIVEVLEGNKENVVTGMANLSIADDEGSRKLTGGSNKPNGEQPQFLGGTPLANVLPTNSAFEAGTSEYGCQPASAPHNNTIESLLGKISGQADNIRKLKSSDAGLISKVNGLTSSNAELTLSNADLLDIVRKLAESNNDMSSTLRSVSQRFSASCRSLLSSFFSAAYQNTPRSKPPHGPRRHSI
jgi:hypothetical protein